MNVFFLSLDPVGKAGFTNKCACREQSAVASNARVTSPRAQLTGSRNMDKKAKRSHVLVPVLAAGSCLEDGGCRDCDGGGGSVEKSRVDIGQQAAHNYQALSSRSNEPFSLNNETTKCQKYIFFKIPNFAF